MSSFLDKIKWPALITLSIIFLAFMLPELWLSRTVQDSISVPLNSTCDLRAGPCVTAVSNSEHVSFSILPRSIPLAKTLQLEVIITGLNATKVTVDLNGVDMNMGLNSVELTKTAENKYSGKGIISYCSRRLMEWESVVEITSANKKISVPFRFITSTDISATLIQQIDSLDGRALC